VLAGALTCALPLHAQEATEAEQLSNLRVYQALAGEIGDSVFAIVAIPDTAAVAIHVEPEGSSWYIEEGIAAAARRIGRTVAEVPRASYEGRFGVTLAGVEYFDIRRDGLFGSRIVDRSVTLILNVRVVDLTTGNVMLRQERQATYRDVLMLDDVTRVEHANLPETHGELPAEGFFSSAVEPVLVVAAVALAVFLLFTVRS